MERTQYPQQSFKPRETKADQSWAQGRMLEAVRATARAPDSGFRTKFSEDWRQ